MSDFLTNLAARILHAAPTVQPRLNARFEDSTSDRRARFDSGASDEAETVPALPESLRPANLTTTAGPLNARHLPGELRIHTSNSDPGDRKRSTQSSIERNSRIFAREPGPHLNSLLRSDGPTTGSQAAADSASESASDRLPKQTVAEVRATKGPMEVIARVHSVEARPRENGQVVVPYLLGAGSDLSQHANSFTPVSADMQESKARPTADHDEAISEFIRSQALGAVLEQRLKPTNNTRQEGESRRGREQSRPESIVDSVPIVHVTIGRIEVQAVVGSESAPNLQPAPTAMNSPLLSLKDFLKQRSGESP